MKKICFISTLVYPLFNSKSKITFGGAEVQVYNYSRKLSECDDYKISIILRNLNKNFREVNRKIELYNYLNLKQTTFSQIKSPFLFYLTLKKINPDIIICRAKGLGVFYSLIYRLIRRKKLIYMIACDNDVNGVFFKGFMGIFFYIGIRYSDYLIAQNCKQFEDYKRIFKKDNIDIINNSFVINEKMSSKSKNILWVGRSDLLKRPELFLKLADLYPNVKFIMIMNKGNDIKTWNKYSKLAREQKNIQFIEKVPFNDIQKYFDEAKVFINTSEYEGFPNTFIQACLGSTPILSYKVNPNDFITKNELGLVSNNSFEQFVKDFDKIMNDDKLWKSMSKNAFDYVKLNHDIEKNYKVIQRVISYILKNEKK